MAVGAVGLGFYLATLAPGLTWAHDSADGGELAAAASTLGIPHPPGYPTYVLVGHLFTLLPVGEVATRTNLFSAVCAAAAAASLTWTLARATGRKVAAASAGLALAFCPLLWSQATVTEVHALSALFATLLLALAVLAEAGSGWPRRPAALLALAVGGVWGLSLGNHPTALLCGPLVALSLWRLRRFGLIGVVGIGLGLAVYSYLPLRAAASPAINWGDPRTPERFWWVVSGAPYRQFIFSVPLASIPQRLLAWAGLVAQQFGWIGLAVAALGAAGLWTADRSLLVASGAMASLFSVFAIGYNTTDSYLYLIPALACLGFWLGAGASWLIGVLEARKRWLSWVAASLAIGLPLTAAVCRFPALDLSDDHTTAEFEAAVLAQAPSEAVILTQRDAHTFALWYFQYALGRRTDIVVVDTGLLGYGWYTAQLPHRPLASLPADALMAGDAEALRQAAEALGRPVCWISSDGMGLSCEGQ